MNPIAFTSIAKKSCFVRFLVLACFFIILPHCDYAISATQYSSDEVKRAIADMRHDIKNNSDDISIIRRDEINYAIEKNILKESYDSSMQKISETISIVSVVVGFIFAIAGYMGFRTIGKLKEDYSNELQAARILKAGLEADIEGLRKKQENIEIEVDRLNKNQGTKIEMLELAEKAQQLFNLQNYEWAIECIKVGLEIDKNYIPLLLSYALCETKLGNLGPAVERYRKVLEINPDNKPCLLNFAEILLLAKLIPEYDALYKKHSEMFDAEMSGNLIIFFKTLRAIQTDNLEGAKEILIPFVEKDNSTPGGKLGNWQMDDVNRVVLGMPAGDLKSFAEKLILYFAGGIPKEAMQEALTGQTVAAEQR